MAKRARAKRPGAAAAAPPKAAVDLADRLHSAAIHLLRRVRREDAASGIPAPRLSALSVIVFRGPMTLSDLAAAEQVRPPTVTRVVAALEADGLVTREAGREDRRVTWVGATPRGVRVLEEGRLRRVEALARELAALEGRDRDTLARAIDLLERIVGPRHRPVRREE